MQQCYKQIGAPPAVPAAELAFYRACVSEHSQQTGGRRGFWNASPDPVCKLYRIIKQLKLPTMKRVVPNDSGEDVKGTCYGLSVGRNKQAFVGAIPTKAGELIKAVRDIIDETDP